MRYKDTKRNLSHNNKLGKRHNLLQEKKHLVTLRFQLILRNLLKFHKINKDSDIFL